MNDMDQTEFDFSEPQETEQERLEREVLAAGGRVGKKEGRFTFGFDEGDGYKRGDEHREIAGLFFWRRGRQMYGSASRWLSADELINVGSKPRPVSSVNMCHLTAKVLAAGGRVGYKEGRFSFHRGAATGLKRGDLHKSIDGIYFWARHKRDSIWLDEALYHEMDHKRLDAIRLMSEEESLRRKARQAAWRANNRKRLAAGSRRWARKNKAKNSERAARRREVGATANQAIIDSRYTAREFLKANTDIDWHVDHTVPISKGGKHHEDNLQVVPAGWNRSKGANHCDRWIEDSNIYRYATAVEKRFEEEAKKSEEK